MSRYTKPAARPKPAITIYADETFFDIEVALLYAMAPDLLDYESAVFGVRVPGAPRVTLSADDDVHDVTVTVPIELKVLGTRHPIKVLVRGWLECNDGVVQLGRIDIDVDARSNFGEDLLERLVDWLTRRIQGGQSFVQLPTVERVLGKDLDAQVFDAKIVEVRGRPMFCVTASVGANAVEPFPIPLPEDLQHNPPPEGVGGLIVLIPQSAINGLLAALIDNYEHQIRVRIGPDLDQLRIKGRIVVGDPVIKLYDGTVAAHLDVSFKGLKAGTHFFGDTDWNRLKLKRVDAGIEAAMVTGRSGRDASLVVRAFKGIKPKFKNRTDFSDRLFERAIDDVARTFNRVLRQRLEGKRLQLLEIPRSARVSDERVNISVGGDGLAVRDGMLVAPFYFDIADDDPANDLAEYWNFQQIKCGLTHVIDRGSGHPVIFIPDMLAGVKCWQGQVDHLARYFRTVAYAWRGMGRSEGGRWPYRLGALVRDLRQLTAELDIDQPILVGQGYGALVAARYATRYKSGTRALVLVPSVNGLMAPAVPIKLFQKGTADNAQGSLSERFFARRLPLAVERMWQPETLSARPDLIAAWKARFRANSIVASLTAMWARRFHRLKPRHLADIGMPVAVVRGTDDTELAALVAEMGAEDLVLPETSNMPMVEQRVAFNTALRAFAEQYVDG